MSHSFYIHDVADASLQATLDALPFENLIVDTEVGEAGWPAVARVYQDRVSVRSIETAMENGTLQVRIMANSSPDDFRLAAAITDQVARTHGRQIEPEDNEAMSVEQWAETYGSEWQEEQCRTYLQMLVGMYRDPRHEGGVLSMWGTRGEFKVGPRLMEPLLTDPQNFSKHFFDRFRRFNYLDREDVYVAQLMAAQQQETGKQAVFCVLGEDVPTALSTEAAFVVLNHRGLGSDAEPGRTVLSFDDFVELAGNTLTWLGDGIALTPAYQADQWQDLLSRAANRESGFFDRPELLRDADGDATGDEDTGALGISEQHWEILATAPVAVFLLTAGADGNVDKKEIAAFQKKIIEGALVAGDSKVMQLAIVRATAGIDKRLAQVSQMAAEDIARLVAASRQVVEAAADEDEAQFFAQALLSLAESVAKASGGGFLGFGSKIGKEEMMVLEGLRSLLRLDPPRELNS